MRGTTQECFEHYAEKILRPSLEKRQLATRFFGTEGYSVLRWIKSQKLPYGENLIRLQFLLEFASYEVEELAKLSAPVREAGRLFAFGVISADEIIKVCGFGRNQFLRLLTGRINTIAIREVALSTLVEKHKNKLREMQAPFQPLADTPTDGSERKSVISAPLPRIEISATMLDKEACLKAFVFMARAMKPIAEALLSSLFTPDERRMLHDRSGNETIFELSTALNRLCSEKSRKTRRK